ncbi:hypothetical protein [Geodermatophilus sp. SYSU D00710]
MSEASTLVAAVLLVAVPTVEIGGVSLLAMISRKIPGYLDNPVRRHLFRAGHAHAGVWIVFALVGLLYVDQTDLSGGWKAVVRTGFAIAPILMPLGFFLSILRPDADRPNGVLWLTILGGLALAVVTVTLGIGLFLT